MAWIAPFWGTSGARTLSATANKAGGLCLVQRECYPVAYGPLAVGLQHKDSDKASSTCSSSIVYRYFFGCRRRIRTFAY
jgi:hypothetical protein